MYTIAEIRQKLATAENTESLKDAVRNYLRSRQLDFQYAVTLTFQPCIKVTTTRGVYSKALDRGDVEKAAAKFKRRLNDIALGSSAKRHGNSLNYFFVVEGERSCKQMHLHLIVGGELRKIKRCEFMQAVVDAAALCEHIGTQIDVQVPDSGWLEYMTKEVGKHDTENVLWELA